MRQVLLSPPLCIYGNWGRDVAYQSHLAGAWQGGKWSHAIQLTSPWFHPLLRLLWELCLPITKGLESVGCCPSSLSPGACHCLSSPWKNDASKSNKVPDLSIISTEFIVTAYVMGGCCAWSKRTQMSKARSQLSTTSKTSGRKCEQIKTSSVAISSGKKKKWKKGKAARQKEPWMVCLFSVAELCWHGPRHLLNN